MRLLDPRCVKTGRPARVGEHEDVEQLGAGSGTERVQALTQQRLEFVDLFDAGLGPSWRRPPRCPHSGQRLRSLPLLQRHARGETLPVSGRRDRVAVEHDPL
jgi:hypothetical protein